MAGPRYEAVYGELLVIERERLVWHPAGAVVAFAFDLAAAFAQRDGPSAEA